MFAPEADVVLANGLVKIACKEVIHLAIPQIGVGGGMALFDKLPNEIQAALAGLTAHESKELLAGEVGRVRCDRGKKTSLILGIAKRTQSNGVHPCDVHRAKISAVISWVSRTRRSLG